MKTIAILIPFLFSILAAAQSDLFENGPSKTQTDSSTIFTHLTEEFKIENEYMFGSDTIHSRKYFISKPSQISLQGSQTSMRRYGVWKEFNIHGAILWEVDYNHETYSYDANHLKFQKDKEVLKAIADSILISKFGQAFFENNIQFFFEAVFLNDKRRLGDWTSQLKQSPNIGYFKYALKISDHEVYRLMINLDVNLQREILPPSFYLAVPFKKIKVSRKEQFKINRELAIELCQKNPQKKSEEEYFTKLIYGGYSDEYYAQFYYEVHQQNGSEFSGDPNGDRTIIKYRNLWRFDPWTLELIYNQPIKIVSTFKRGVGHGETFIDN